MTWPARKRLSLESVHVTPNGTLQVACWGVGAGLEFHATDDADWSFDIQAGTYNDANKQNYVLGTKLTDTQCKITDVPCDDKVVAVKKFQFKEPGQYRIVLKMGAAIWDWMRVYVMQKAPDSIADKKVTTGTINVDFVWAVKENVGINYLPHTLQVTELLLAKYGMKFNAQYTKNTPTRYLPGFEDGIICRYDDYGNLQKVHDQAKAKGFFSGKALTVVMGNAREVPAAADDTKRLAGCTVSKYENKFVVLNVNAVSVDGATLLHEIGHAAGFCSHESAGSHFMSYGTMRNEVTKGNITDFEKAFFRSTP
ncbi:hypothetical protein F183_A13610 [Bryobacterales bacterium F-183]|nr:hypothetical protein F183_A13610 [Bryobacterales bacterium F-183]